MKVRSHILSPSVARGIAVMCTSTFVATAPAAHAGINVWTSHGPPGGAVYALAIDPITPRTLYAGTFGSGVFKSTDAGATWGAANAGITNTYVYRLAIDPSTPRTLYAGTQGEDAGVFKSTDAGATWNAANAGQIDPLNANVYALAIDPSTPQTLYAGTFGKAVLKSTDAGASWAASNAGLPNGVGVSALAINPSTPSTLYAATLFCDDSCVAGGIFKSTDAGATWGAANAPSFGYALAIDPSTPQTLYAGNFGEAVFKSTDAGATWGASNAGLPEDTSVVALTIDPVTPQTLYAGTGDGVFKSTDGGSTWDALNAGLSNTIVALGIDPMEPRLLYAGTAGGGVFAIEQVPPSCVGDCEGADSVAINDLITLVNIALGTNAPSACPNGGLPLGGEVDVAVILQAVNHALNGCGVGT